MCSHLGQPGQRWGDGEAQPSAGLLHPGLAWDGAGGWRGEEGGPVLLVLAQAAGQAGAAAQGAGAVVLLARRRPLPLQDRVADAVQAADDDPVLQAATTQQEHQCVEER